MDASEPVLTPDHPERLIAVAHARSDARRGFAALLALDERLGTIVARAKEPGIGLLRLVWWRDALTALDEASPPAEPLLVAAASLRGRGVAGIDLAAMTEGWEALLDDPEVGDPTVQIHANQRGARLFALAGRLLGIEDDRLVDAGRGWALADLARHFAPADRADALFEAARAPLERAMAQRWPVALRPLGMVASLALQDARRGAGALQSIASRRRLIRMLAHRWTGR